MLESLPNRASWNSSTPEKSILYLNRASKLAVVLPRATVDTAFALQAFQQSGHQFFDNETTTELRHTIRAVTSTNIQPVIPHLPASATRASASPEPPAFPAGWATDRSAFRAAARQFQQETEAYRARYLQPHDTEESDSSSRASTGATAPGSLSLAPRPKYRFLTGADDSPIPGRKSTSTSESSHRPTTESGETSAEEAIYDRPIGPENNTMPPPLLRLTPPFKRQLPPP